MSKKLWFVIILLLIVAGVSAACAYSPDVKSTVAGGLQGIGGSIWVSLSTGWSNLATAVGASGTYFLLYTCAALLFGGILFVVLNRARNAGKIPLMNKPAPKMLGTSTSTYSSTPLGATTRPETSTPTNLASPPPLEEELTTETK